MLIEIKELLHEFFWNNDSFALLELFRIIDLNGDHFLTHGIIHKLLRASFSDTINIEECQAMIAEADVLGRGKVDVNEFIAVMKKHRQCSESSGWSRLKVFNPAGT